MAVSKTKLTINSLSVVKKMQLLGEVFTKGDEKCMEEVVSKYYKQQKFLIDELMHINSMFSLYIYLKNQHNERLDILNISPAFFGLTENALVENSLIRLGRVYDKNSNAITINKFLNCVEQNQKKIKLSI